MRKIVKYPLFNVSETLKKNCPKPMLFVKILLTFLNPSEPPFVFFFLSLLMAHSLNESSHKKLLFKLYYNILDGYNILVFRRDQYFKE